MWLYFACQCHIFLLSCLTLLADVIFLPTLLSFHLSSCYTILLPLFTAVSAKQCDLMARLLVLYLAICNNQNLPNIISKFFNVSSKFCQILNTHFQKGQSFATVVKFRQMWSHCCQIHPFYIIFHFLINLPPTLPLFEPVSGVCVSTTPYPLHPIFQSHWSNILSQPNPFETGKALSDKTYRALRRPVWYQSAASRQIKVIKLHL